MNETELTEWLDAEGNRLRLQKWLADPVTRMVLGAVEKENVLPAMLPGRRDPSDALYESALHVGVRVALWKIRNAESAFSRRLAASDPSTYQMEQVLKEQGFSEKQIKKMLEITEGDAP